MNVIYDWEVTQSGDSAAMVRFIRQSLTARLEGRNEGGDTEVMRLIDEIVKKEAHLYNGHDAGAY